MATRARTRAVSRAATSGDIAGIYERISEDREGKELGVDRQDTLCKALAARLGVKVFRVYCDNDIGASTRSAPKPREEYNAMLADAKAGVITMIIAYSDSRLTRRPRENEDLIDLAVSHGVTYAYVKSPKYDLNTADGREAARTAAARNAGESERIGERVSAARVQRVENGGNGGGGNRPYGFGVLQERLVNKLVVQFIDYTLTVPDEVKEIRSWADDVLSTVSVPLRSIVLDLQRREVPTVTGAKWTERTVRGILLRPRTAGFTEYDGEEVGRLPGEPILTEEVWRAIVAKLTDPKRSTHQTGGAPRWLGSGIYLCPCGSTVEAQAIRNSYRCKALRYENGGGHVRRNATALDQYVTRRLVERLSSRDAFNLHVKSTDPGVDLNALQIERKALVVQLSEWDSDRTAGHVTRARWLTQTAQINGRIAEIDRMYADATRVSATAQFVAPANPYGQLADTAIRWEGLSLGKKRAILNENMVVTILPAVKEKIDQPGATTWTEYGECGSCGASAGSPCLDLLIERHRKADEATVAKSRPHVGRKHLGRKLDERFVKIEWTIDNADRMST